MFADRAKIFVRSGKGGDGHVSFRRELYVPNGGPDGGDGGDGGNVVFVVDQGLNTLTDFRNIRKYKAEDGEEGRKRNCHGANGKDVVLSVPPGTVIRDFDVHPAFRDHKRQTEDRGLSFYDPFSEPRRCGSAGCTGLCHGGYPRDHRRSLTGCRTGTGFPASYRADPCSGPCGGCCRCWKAVIRLRI